MKIICTTLLSILAASATPVYADVAATVEAPARRDLHLDLEVDPLAYVFSGYSVHAGIGWKSLRLDLGVYAMDLPELLHGNEGWDASFDGGGLKLQWFFLDEQRGPFIDVSAGISRQKVELAATGATQTEDVLGVGIDAGWRFALPYGFYATPWVGASYDLNSDDVMLDGQTFAKRKLLPFAAVHLGFRFR